MAVLQAAQIIAGTASAERTSKLAVYEQSPEVKKMAEVWPMLEALRGGTKAMREAGEAYLPSEPREGTADYVHRARTATLYDAFGRTVAVMSGKPFSKQLQIGEDTPKSIEALVDNIDNQGRNAHAFFFDVFEESMSYGLCGVLVDSGRLEIVPGAVATAADVRAQNIRPFFAFIKHGDILGWKKQIVNGRIKLTQLRLREKIVEDDGDYGTTETDAVRVLEPGSWKVMKQTGGSGSETWVEHSKGTNTLGEIPFVPFYGKRRDFMVGESPLQELAYQNVKHWQIQSDQDDSARFARKRMLVFIGVSKKEVGDIEASSSSALMLANKEASVQIIQGSAESVTVGRNELSDLEEQMVRTGAELLVKKPSGQRTATQDNNEAEASKSDLQRMTETTEDAIDQCFQFMAEFLSETEGGHWQLFKDFGASNLSDASASLVKELQASGMLTKPTTLREMQRRGVISPDIDVDEELAAVEEEGPAPGMVGLDALGNLLPEPNALPGTPIPPAPSPPRGVPPALQ